MTPNSSCNASQKPPPAAGVSVPRPRGVSTQRLPPRAGGQVLAPEDRENGLSRHDLEETTLANVLDDARSLSLFAPNRVVWVSGAETALPRGRAASDDETPPRPNSAAYLKHPTPGTVLVFEASRYDFEGEDRAKIERVQKFYAAIPEVVELRPYTLESARRLAQDLAKEAGLQIGLAEIGLLVESLAADAGRIANEIEKLRLYTGGRAQSNRRRYPASGSERAGVHYFRAGRGAWTRRSQAVARQPGHAVARRRISAAGPDVPGHAIPAGYGGARFRAQNVATDPGAFYSSRAFASGAIAPSRFIKRWAHSRAKTGARHSKRSSGPTKRCETRVPTTGW